MAMPALTRAQSEATTPAERAACERMSDAAERRGLTVFGPSSFVVPEADPNTPAFCVSSQRRNGAWHLVWLQTVDGPLGPVQRLMCSCPARQSPRVFTCSHAQAVRLHLAAQCAAGASRPRSSVKSGAGAPSSEGASGAAGVGAGLGSAEALRRAEFDRRLEAWLEEQRRDTPITWTVETHADDSEIPAVPPDAVESLNAWSDALYVESLAAQMAEDDARDPLPTPKPDDDDDPDPTPPAAAALPVPAEPGEGGGGGGEQPAESKRVACPSCGQLANPDDVREIGTCLDCVLAAEVESAEQQPGAPEESEEPEEPEEPTIVVHCPRCGREADPDAVAEHGACARCIYARPETSQSAKRTPEQKAEARRRIIDDEQQRQTRYRRTGRDDDPRREEQRREAGRERAAKAEARRRERRESDDNPRADHETAPLYRDNRPISPFRETRTPYTVTQPQPDDSRYLGTNDIGQRFYAVGEHQTIFTIHHELHPDHPCRQFFYCTWACWLTRGHEMAGVTIDHDTGAITGFASQPQPDPRALQARLLRLGGDFERARLDRDHARAIAAGEAIARTGAQLPEDYAWHLTVIRGRNAIRRARGLEPIHY